jgi:hypothetical protein
MSGAINQAAVVRRYQMWASLALLAILAGTVLTIDLLARNRGLERRLMAISTQLARKNEILFSNTGNFIDFEDRVLLDAMPNADYSHGGVYFFGTSNMKWAFTTWDLPADQKRFIGNYGIGASSHSTQLMLIRYLIEKRNFLAAGDRNLVVLGVSFHLARPDPSTGFFASLLHRHGLYVLTADHRIAPVPMTVVESWLRIEKARSGGFIWNVGRLVKNWATALAGMPRHPTHDGERYRQNWREFMGTNWQQDMDTEVSRLKETILLLRSYHARVKVILLPQGTWMDELPFKARYEALIRAVCAATSTPLIDFSRSMPDEAFVDSNHLTVDGQEKFRGLVMGEIIRHLQSAGLYQPVVH